MNLNFQKYPVLFSNCEQLQFSILIMDYKN